RGGCSYAGGACMIVGAPPSVRRVKPEHRAGRCSHPERVFLRRRSMLIVGAPPPGRSGKPEHRTSRCSHPGRVLLRGRCVLIVGAPPPVRRVKPKHRTSRYSHPGRVLLRWKRVLIAGAPPSVRRVSQNTGPALVRTRGGCSYGGRVLIVGAPPPVRRVKPEHRAGPCSHPGRVLLRRSCVLDCRSTAPGAKGEARAPSRPLFAPGAGAPTVEACVDCRS